MDNRARYRQLLKTYKITQAQSADLIEAVTMRSCKERTVRTWLADPATASARPCPAYALKALEKAIAYMYRAVQQPTEA